MGENALWSIFWVAAMLMVCFVATQIRACEAQTSTAIEACARSCGERGVDTAGRLSCECK
jgi:hypothetical protein